jgi:hypothetical protein
MQVQPLDRSQTRPASGAGVASSAASAAVGDLAKPNTSRTYAPTESLIVSVSGQVAPNPDKPSATTDAPNKDWTLVKQKDTSSAPKQPPPEPISKQLLAFINSMWKASGSVVELAAQQASADANRLQNETNKQGATPGLLVYAKPSVQKAKKL